MKVRFFGGPWDGVEFEAPSHPDAIAFRILDVDAKFPGGDVIELRSAVRNHHQYFREPPEIIAGIEPKVGVHLEREPEEGEELWMVAKDEFVIQPYRHAPYEKLFWERENQ